jgi:hypothetical protein
LGSYAGEAGGEATVKVVKDKTNEENKKSSIQKRVGSSAEEAYPRGCQNWAGFRFANTLDKRTAEPAINRASAVR